MPVLRQNTQVLLICTATTNLCSYLRQHHPNEYELIRPQKVKPTNTTALGFRTITDAFKLAAKYPQHLLSLKQ